MNRVPRSAAPLPGTPGIRLPLPIEVSFDEPVRSPSGEGETLLAELLPSGRPTPLDALLVKDRRRRLRKALMSMAPMDRAFLVMHANGMTLEEIGNRFGYTREAVRLHSLWAIKKISGAAHVVDRMVVPCAACGKEFRRVDGHQKYCSSACTLTARRGLSYGEADCAKCGSKYVKATSHQKYCSYKCQRLVHDARELKRTRMKGTSLTRNRVCASCGKEFSPTSSNSKYCGAECRVAIRKKGA